MPRDLNEEVRRDIARTLDRAVFKGASRLTDTEIVLVFEQQGTAYELRVLGDEHGICPILRERR